MSRLASLPYQALPYKVLAGLVCSLMFSGTSWATDLPERQTTAPETTNSVPHVQFNVSPDPVLSEALIGSISNLPGVYTANTANSLAGARGFRLRETINVTRQRSLLGGREFAHLHADGSLHAFLSPKLAREAIEKGWGTWHPWAGQNPGWDGFIMIYTPSNAQELETVAALVKASYNYVTQK